MPGTGYSPTQDFDATQPAGSTKGYDADDDIRDNMMHMDNAVAVEHYAPSNDPDASEDDFGRHDYITLKEQASKPSLTSSTNRAALYKKSDGIYIEDEDGTEILLVDLTNQLSGNDIPHGEIIVFDKDTVVTGYTLQTDKDDLLLFITKGSVAGGETGGGDHSTGTWTQPDHTLTESEIPAHTHSYTVASAAGNQSTGDDKARALSSSTTGSTGGGGAHNHGTTWRPAARCFTRQARN